MPNQLAKFTCRGLILAVLVSSFGLAGCTATLKEQVIETTDKLISQANIAQEPARGKSKSIAVVLFSEKGRSRLSAYNTVHLWEMLDQHIINLPHFSSISPQVIQAVLEKTDVEQKDLHTEKGRKRFLSQLHAADQTPQYLLIGNVSRQKKTQPGFSTYDLIMTFEFLRAADSSRLSKSTLTVAQ